MASELHLVRIPVDVRALTLFANRSKAGGRRIDVGYAVHALFGALFDHGADEASRVAPKPFFAADVDHPTIDVLGYSAAPAAALVQRARQFADPLAWSACNLDAVVSRPMPAAFAEGMRLAFETRVCPTRRVKRNASRGWMESERAEVDAFVAAAAQGASEREPVYRAWVAEQLGRDGAASLESASMTSLQFGRFLRRTQGVERESTRGERPDVTFRGVLRVENAPAFSALLARGLGRHRAFGFGMLLLKPAPAAG